MKLGNKGFAISGILYSLLILFVTLFIGILTILASTKFSYDKVKNDIIDKLENLVYKDDILNGADPVLKTGMIPVTIDNSGVVRKANLRTKWYDYDAKMWANAVTVSGTNRQAYMDAPAGTVIAESDILTYFVWIPRYRYKLWYVDAIDEDSDALELDKVHSIDIVFENKNTIKSIGTKDGDYLTHPAFTFGDELNGIWVGKFETGYNGATTTTGAEVEMADFTKVVIKSNNYSWRNMNVSNMYATSMGMNATDNVYGLSTDSDTHMMKNTEWGAVAYLSHSKYGTCTNGTCREVYINNNANLVTGCGADSLTEELVLECKNQFGTRTDGIYNQTTNGNISGIFDMSGGAWEYVMGYTTDSTTPYGSSGFNATTYPAKKYIDEYTSTSETEYSGRKLGDATGEMGPFKELIGSWYSDKAIFADADSPWFLRGGNGDSSAGLFYFDKSPGTNGTGVSFRIVLV